MAARKARSEPSNAFGPTNAMADPIAIAQANAALDPGKPRVEGAIALPASLPELVIYDFDTGDVTPIGVYGGPVDLAAAVDVFKERFPDDWEALRLCPLQHGLDTMIEKLKA